MADLFRHGYTIAELVLSDSACDRIVSALPEVADRRGGVRNLIEHPTVMAMLRDRRFAAAIEVPGLVAVKATLFDKTAESNWRVQWHQDRMIAVRERAHAEGFGAWTVKNGVAHVEPPARVLEEMVAVRVHLDDCGPASGPLRVIPGSHRRGKLNAEEIAALAGSGPIAELTLPQGALLVMRPLLVHASAPMRVIPGEVEGSPDRERGRGSLDFARDDTRHRRVLHIELAPRDAITPLQWHSVVPLGCDRPSF